MEDPPAGWTTWSAEDDRLILAFRPDVFDADDFPAPCLPTLYLTRGRRNRRRPGEERAAALDWFVTLYLEPEVTVREERFEDREAANAFARELATAFADGEMDVRECYQVPREAYLDELEALTGRT